MPVLNGLKEKMSQAVAGIVGLSSRDVRSI